MLVIRLLRTGKKNQPTYKVVVTEKTSPPVGGRFLEEVGFYNPLTKERILRAERIKHWISQGAQPSDTVYNMLVTEQIVEGKKRIKHKKPAKQEEAQPAEAAAPAAEAVPEAKEAPAEEEKPAEAPAEETKAEEPKEAPTSEEEKPKDT